MITIVFFRFKNMGKRSKEMNRSFKDKKRAAIECVPLFFIISGNLYPLFYANESILPGRPAFPPLFCPFPAVDGRQRNGATAGCASTEPALLPVQRAAGRTRRL